MDTVAGASNLVTIFPSGIDKTGSVPEGRPSRPNCSLIISTDASNAGIGAVLLQVQENPIYHASRSLNDTEKRHAAIDKETLAVTCASETFPIEYSLSLRQIISPYFTPELNGAL